MVSRSTAVATVSTLLDSGGLVSRFAHFACARSRHSRTHHRTLIKRQPPIPPVRQHERLPLHRHGRAGRGVQLGPRRVEADHVLPRVGEELPAEAAEVAVDGAD
jgi:hypothetical protein